METKAAPSIAWDQYFPLINKSILALLVVGGLLIASGVDIVQLGGRMIGRSSDTEPALSASDLPSLSTGTAASKLGGKWRTAILVAGGVLGIVALVISVLSLGGRDAQLMKEQHAPKKKEAGPETDPAASQSKAAPLEETECNLSSYKLFYPTPNQDVAGTVAH